MYIKRWMNTLIEVEKADNPVKCPFCGELAIQKSFNQMDKESKRGYGVVWCDSCKKAIHVGSMIVSDDQNNQRPIPKGLIYS